MAGLQSAGVAACAKHFPGHGSTGDDSHLSLATVSGTLAEIRTRDLPPFVAAIAAGSLAIMPGHLRVPELTGSLPASLSPAAVAGLLRGELGFAGVVICDALEMKAASAAFGIPEAAVLAVIAGVDLLCLGRDTDEAMYHAVRAALADAVTSGRLAGARLEEAAAPGRRRCGPGLPRPGAALPSGRSAVSEASASARGRDRAGRRAARAAPLRSGPRGAHRSADCRGRARGEHRRRPVHLGLRAVGGRPRGSTPPPATARRRTHCSRRPRAVRWCSRSGTRAARSRWSTSVLAARPDAVIVEMGVPAWMPPPGTAYLATYGASRVCAQAAAEALGLA